MGRAAKQLFPFSKRLAGLFALLFGVGMLLWWVNLPDRQLASFDPGIRAQCITSDDGSTLALTSLELDPKRGVHPTTRILDASTLRTRRALEGPFVLGGLSTDGSQLAAITGPELRYDGMAEVVDTRTGEAVPIHANTRKIVLSPDGKTAVIPDGSNYFAKLLYSLPSTTSRRISCTGEPLVFSPDGNLLACAVQSWGPGGGIYVYHSSSGKKAAYLASNTLAFSRDGLWVAVDEAGGRAAVYSTLTWKRQRSYHVGINQIHQLSFSNNGSYLGIGSYSGVIVLDRATGVRMFTKLNGSAWPAPLFIHNDTAIAFMQSRQMKVWELAPRAKLLARAYLRKITGQD